MPETLSEPPATLMSSDAAMAIVQSAVNETTGKSVPITRETRIDRYLNDVVGAVSIEYLDLMFRLEEALGINLSNEDWNFLSGWNLVKSTDEWEAKYAPHFTFGRLADLVALRVGVGTIQPLTILGATSMAAGAFRCIEKIATDIEPGVPSFGPGTPILDRFRGEPLRRFWARIRAISGNRIPPLAKGRGERIFDRVQSWTSRLIVLTLPTIAGSFFAGKIQNPVIEDWAGSIFMLSCTLLLVLILMWIAVILIMPRVLRRYGLLTESAQEAFPQYVETFRDLALVLAGERGGWCERCGYDMSGLQGRPCPECGTVLAFIGPGPFPSRTPPADGPSFEGNIASREGASSN